MADDDRSRARTPARGTAIVDRDALSDLRGAIDELHAIASELRDDVIDIKGKGGDNGKLGEMRRQLSGVQGWLRWALISAAASVMTSGTLIFKSGLQIGRAENRIENLESRYNELRQTRRWQIPATTATDTPTKDATP